MGYTPTKLKREYINNLSSISSDTLKQAVSDKQLADNDVVRSLVKLPVEEFNNVKEAAKKLLNDNELFNATKQYLIDERKWGAKIAEQNLLNSKLLYKSNQLASIKVLNNEKTSEKLLSVRRLYGPLVGMSG